MSVSHGTGACVAASVTHNGFPGHGFFNLHSTSRRAVIRTDVTTPFFISAETRKVCSLKHDTHRSSIIVGAADRKPQKKRIVCFTRCENNSECCGLPRRAARSARQAVARAHEFIAAGHAWVVDLLKATTDCTDFTEDPACTPLSPHPKWGQQALAPYRAA